MKFGGLSEKEIQKITELLSAEQIVFEVKTDAAMLDNNDESMKNNLRHLNSPSISTHVLSLVVEENAFSKMSKSLKNNLLELGITDEVPSELDFLDKEPELIQKELIKGDKRLIGKSFLHQLVVGVGALLIYLLIKKL
jgi:hypothetical protein